MSEIKIAYKKIKALSDEIQSIARPMAEKLEKQRSSLMDEIIRLREEIHFVDEVDPVWDEMMEAIEDLEDEHSYITSMQDLFEDYLED